MIYNLLWLKKKWQYCIVRLKLPYTTAIVVIRTTLTLVGEIRKTNGDRRWAVNQIHFQLESFNENYGSSATELVTQTIDVIELDRLRYIYLTTVFCV